MGIWLSAQGAVKKEMFVVPVSAALHGKTLNPAVICGLMLSWVSVKLCIDREV
jgi:hypothetical protein